jgi:SAM-dependent methyltransferase
MPLSLPRMSLHGGTALWILSDFTVFSHSEKRLVMYNVEKMFRDIFLHYQFSPAFPGIFVNPFWMCRRALYRELRKYAPRLIGIVLDFGCGTSPYRALFTHASSYMGLEYDPLGGGGENRPRKHADIFYDGRRIPLEDASVDAVLSTQTLEHVPDPDRTAGEWARILRKEGLLLLTVPLMWPEHEMPHDFQRWTAGGLRLLLEKHGFAVIAQDKLLCDCRAPAQLFLAWLYDVLRFGKRSFTVRIILSFLLFAPVALSATVLAAVAPADVNTYMDNIILAEKQ